jgi:hypothetical protein
VSCCLLFGGVEKVFCLWVFELKDVCKVEKVFENVYVGDVWCG